MPLGAILGSLAGGLGAGLGFGTRSGRKSLFGDKGKFQQVPRFTPEQQQLQSQLLEGLGQLSPEIFSRLQELLGGDDEAFSKFEAPFLRQFERQVLPGIAERFGGSAGSHGALSSGGLNQALAQAGTDLSTNLASLRGGLQQQALGQIQGLFGTGFQPSFESVYRQPRTGLLGGLAQGAGSGLGQYGALRFLG